MGIVLNLGDFQRTSAPTSTKGRGRRQFRSAFAESRRRDAAPQPGRDVAYLERLVRRAEAEAGLDEARCSLVLERLIAEALAL